jgi:uncharacterized protein (DUF58 family)
MTLAPHLDDLLELRHQAHTLGLASHHPVNSQLAGLYASVFRGQGLDFEEVREYRLGDEIRNMDWRVTARTRKPHLKVFREERERAVVLCVDVGQHMGFGTRGTFKSIQAARAAALLGWAANGQQDRVGAVLFGNPKTNLAYFRPSRARRDLWRVLRALTASGHPGQVLGDPLRDALQRLSRGLPWGSLVFIIADLNREVTSLEQLLGGLRQRHEVVLLPVDDPADWEIPEMGRLILATPQGSRLEVDTDSVEGRQMYRETWERTREQLRKTVRRLGLDIIPLHTWEDIHRSLVKGLRRRLHRQVIR